MLLTVVETIINYVLDTSSVMFETFILEFPSVHDILIRDSVLPTFCQGLQ